MFLGAFLVFFSFCGVSFSFSLFNFIGLKGLSFFIDFVSLIFMGVLMVILGSVLFFSKYYMVEDLSRFWGFLRLVFSFLVSMTLLMFSGDWVSLLLGWDWLGMTSFFLVVYYKSDISWTGGLKTYFTKRLGDGVFLFFMSLAIYYFLFVKLYYPFYFLFLLIFLTQTKSAQFPFCAWLPAAMAAPTPVSALVHSSTLVTAGVYLLIRSGLILNLSSFYVGFIGLLTLFVGSFSACGSFDAKKLVAFSTLSHLGFMVVCLSGGYGLFSFFHLINHACFKALLFMSLGMLMLGKAHCQDFRHLGISGKNLFLVWLAVISVFSLMGLPFFSGFFSKDYLLEHSFWATSTVFYFFFVFSMFFSVYYSFRLVGSLLNVYWQQSLKSGFTYSFSFIYFLLSFSLVLGLFCSYQMKKMCLLSSSFFHKILIYFMFFLGYFLFSLDFSFIFSSNMFFLDSLPQIFFPLATTRLFNFYSFVDQGFLPLLGSKKSIILKKYSFFFNSKMFSFFIIYFLVFFFLV